MKTGRAIGALAAAAVFFTAESEYEKKHFTVKKYRITTDRLDAAWNHTRAVFLSDLHGNSFGADNSRLKQAIRRANPQMILIGGDMLTVKPWEPWEPGALERLLRWMTERYPVYYADGNHEARMTWEPEQYPGWSRDFDAMLKRCGVIRLQDRGMTIRRGSSALHIFGLELEKEYYRKGRKAQMPTGCMTSHLGNAPKEGFRLLLAHSPLYLPEYAAWGADLVLSGHFHGGTVRLPGGQGVMSPQMQFLSRYNRDAAWYNGVPMIISSGLGTHSINVRINNPPQLIVLEWRTPSKKVSDKPGVSCYTETQ